MLEAWSCFRLLFCYVLIESGESQDDSGKIATVIKFLYQSTATEANN